MKWVEKLDEYRLIGNTQKTKMDSIFQVFYSSKPGGTGLGLPIAQRVMEGHGGRIQVESRPGSGTRFTLVFPRRADRRSRAAL